MELQVAILGPLEVRLDGDPVSVGGYRRRALLARLVVAHGRAVAIDVLIDDVWSGSPPPGADATLQSHISALRRALGADRITRVGRSYRLPLAHGELDASLAEAELATARLRMELGDHTEALVAVETALGRWRGEPLADVASQAWAMAEVTRCNELRMQCLDALLEAHCAIGRPELAVAHAEAAVSEFPLRERLWAHLILALYRSGRQADALRAYQRLRVLLAEGLGIDPSPELAELERAVLRQDPSLTAPEAAAIALDFQDTGHHERLVPVGAVRADLQKRGEPDAIDIRSEPVAEAGPDAFPSGSAEVSAEPAPRKKPRHVAVALVVTALVLGATTLAFQLRTDERPNRTGNAPTGSSSTTQLRELVPPPLAPTGSDPKGRTWAIEARITETGDVCTRLNVSGRGVSRELCEPRPSDKPFGRASFIGLRDQGDPDYISWILVSDETARVEAVTGHGNERLLALLVTDSAVGVRCAVSYVNRLQPVTFVAFDSAGQVIGELNLGPVRPPAG